ncbi:hypothetical protein KVA01_08570 [Kocuria varians]|uniref:Uncharacterized protein n=1 Tax=Kocuria varians TaxID=1272 RepID=A0A4Y4D2W5_KOCVA|nr:hypothetical protein [Kocuria varians]GEC98702.1 hypothetical protein KVA01_08570 [Kocuria varians]
MVRNYQRKTDRPSADRNLQVTLTRGKQIDTEKVAEVLIRVALRHADTHTPTGQAGSYLRDLLASER